MLEIYKNKKILITGHTGFKGSWLSAWLLHLGAEVIGISKDIPTNPAMFEILNLSDKLTHYIADIRDLERLKSIISKYKPDFIFHLAAQPIVSVSYENPMETISSNTLGTANVLEALRVLNHKCSAIIITSDKAYDNVEQVWGYKENDKMGGKDIYSGSKGAAELIINSYFHSFFKVKDSCVRLVVGRAGNVIGGGDFAKDRIVADCMKAWSEGKSVQIRSPKSTRPWQHVLEPLSGYLTLGAKLHSDINLNGECFNFGPKQEQNASVEKLLIDLARFWDKDCGYEVIDSSFYEASLLKLNCDKALSYLQWSANLDYENMTRFTASWYLNFYKKEVDMFAFTLSQIKEYENLAKANNLNWASDLPIGGGAELNVFNQPYLNLKASNYTKLYHSLDSRFTYAMRGVA